MSTATPEAAAPNAATSACPSWCDAFHADPHSVDHVRLVDAVHGKPNLESVAVEIEQAVNAQHPRIVLSLFVKESLRGMSAGLSIEQARHAHAVLGEALQLATDGNLGERVPGRLTSPRSHSTLSARS